MVVVGGCGYFVRGGMWMRWTDGGWGGPCFGWRGGVDPL